MAKSNVYNLAVIAGDGIGTEVMPEGLRVLQAVAKKHKFSLDLDHFDFSSCDYFDKHGKMMPDDWKTQIGSHDAIFLAQLACLTACQIIYLYGVHFCKCAASLINMSIFAP